ncbi:RCC1 domain-containing protein [Bifidobacterium kimbladii]|uniref:RCC1 repeat domain protein, 2 domains n=1 Tax=Bifidobacterium asteroides TaxID=1684 RepID=A0A0F4L5Z8_9BIFI|nr:InlB B-repeat-containing protein [Bifidobacterium asteroides]KJY52991.1 RCC1 repeat domain protein, 2 domains [Bifidobacterium asteroides]
MHLVSRLRRILAMAVILLGMLAGLGVASAQADAPIHTGGGGRQTPRVAEQTPGIPPSSAPDTTLSSPSPIQATTPLSPTPGTPSSTTGTPSSTDAAPAKPSEKKDGQASHIVRFDPADGSKPAQSTVKTGTLAAPPQQNPVREGFRFDGWTLDGQPFDLQTPILQDTTLKAQWSKTTDWTLSPDHGPAAGARLTISPPSPQELYYVSIQTSGGQILGLAGDGRIYTWTQESTPKQVPSPAQAPDGFRYLQAAAGSRSQAALGSDQRIYTWDSRQTTPTILDTGKDAGFTSISMNGERLSAVDRQGRVHAYQASNADSQGLNPKFLEQAAISLPGQAQAVTAAASASQALIVDEDGQAWTWEMSKTGKTERVRQQTETRIVQAQALNQGFLLLDADGQARYLPDGKSSPTIVSLPGGEQTGTINSSDNQATIIDKHGHVWAWKPGEAPMRADDGSQQYVQAAAAGGRIAAISRQGSLYRWSLDGQGQPGKPDRLGTTAAPILASASLDGQSLPLGRSNGSWQAEVPARKPGPAAILITGRQDDEPFARSLAYTVDQPPARAGEPGSAFTVRFDTGGGSAKPTDQHVPYPYGRAKRPSPDPAREGFLFDGWFIGEVAYDFSRPVDKDLTLAARWTPAGRNSRWSISPDKGSQLGREPATITPPDSASRGIRFSQVSGSAYDGSASYGFSLAVGSDGNAYAWGNNGYGRLGDGTTTRRTTPVMVRKPDRKTYPDLPADFTYLQVSAGASHSLALGSDGNVYAWGYNYNGQLGDGTRDDKHAPVRVRTPDRSTYPDLPADFTYLQVSAGASYSLAVGSDGNVYAWGSNSNGRLGDGTSSNRYTPVRVKTPDRKTYPDLPADFTYLQVSAGQYHSLAVGSDGNVYAWGSNNTGQLGNGTTSYNAQSTPVRVKTPDRKTYPDLPADFTYLQVSAGYYHSLAVGSDGNAYAWGYNYNGQLGNGTTSNRYTPVRVKTPDRKTYPDLPADFTYLQVSAGGDHSLAVGSDGNAYAWGINNYGQLGNNSGSSSSVPVRMRDPASPTDKSQGLQAAQVSVGYDYSLAVGSDGSAYAWGANGDGQLGDNSTYSKSAPVPVSFNLALVITGVRFDQTPVSGLTRGDGGSVSVTTPAHQPGTVTVSVDYTLGGAPQTPDTSLRYTYLPAGVLPRAGGEGILLALITGTVSMGGVLASRRHRQETRRLVHASHE